MIKLFLIGMPGAGKSYLGRILARFLGICHMDTDEIIEKRSGKSIPDIFHQFGEAHFRKLEEDALWECVSMKEDMVCSTGGGIIEKEGNRDILEKFPTIYIRKSLDELHKNLLPDFNKRPLLRGHSKEHLEKIFKKRRGWFERFPSIELEQGKFELKELLSFLYAIEEKTQFGNQLPEKKIEGIHPVVIKPFIAKDSIQKSEYVITSKTVHAIYTTFFKDQLLILPDGESAKTQSNLTKVWSFLISKAVSREESITGFGGGTITDITGFAASTYKRGMVFQLVPSTLLAQVDAALGGKNAINLEGIKNVCGTFAFPKCVYIDPLVVFSTERGEIENGIVEGLKVALLVHEDVEKLNSQLQLAEKIIENPDLLSMSQFIQQAVQDKMKIVNSDPFEKSKRKFLNLGHSYGHVYESTFNIPHGQAVALGMLKMLKGKKDSVIRDYCTFFEKIVKTYADRLNTVWDDEMWKRLMNDKKNTKDKMVFIDLEKPGNPVQVFVKKSKNQ
ncbi:MAG TPA: shikimate kinase [Thermotogota bacterium]|nr:shikimate kinase [Thermotogota bacterium]